MGSASSLQKKSESAHASAETETVGAPESRRAKVPAEQGAKESFLGPHSEPSLLSQTKPGGRHRASYQSPKRMGSRSGNEVLSHNNFRKVQASAGRRTQLVTAQGIQGSQNYTEAQLARLRQTKKIPKDVGSRRRIDKMKHDEENSAEDERRRDQMAMAHLRRQAAASLGSVTSIPRKGESLWSDDEDELSTLARHAPNASLENQLGALKAKFRKRTEILARQQRPR